MSSQSNRFLEVFKDIIGVEGGYVNNLRDPGGETKFGISKRSYPSLDIRNLTLAQAQDIYWTDFWLRMGCDQMDLGLDEFVFDFGVNSGAPLVARKVQAACGALQDGVIGPNTITAMRRAGPKALFRLLFVERAIIMATQPKTQFDEFCHGWFARLHDKAKEFFTLNGVA